MFRSGVTTNSPEGLRWTAISTPAGCEVAQVSVGPTGLVWAVLFNGRAIVRSGVTRENITGLSWLEVKPPGNGIKITQVSVGTDSVWCVTNDNHVWFRRGVKGEAAGISEDAAIGCGWVEMVGNILMVSVTSNDQVFAVGSEDRSLYFRSAVTASDPTGKKWRKIQVPMQISRTSSTMSLISRRSGSSTPGSKHRSICSLYNKEKAVVETSAIIETVGKVASSVPTAQARLKSDIWKNSTDSPPSVGSLNEHRRKVNPTLKESTQASSAPAAEIAEITGKHYETQLKNPRAWSPVRSVGSIVGTEAHPESDSTVFDADSVRDSGVFGEDEDHTGSQYWTECDVMWTCCAAGAAIIDPTNVPNWFTDSLCVDNKEELSHEWRLDIIKKLKARSDSFKSIDIAKYEKAIEMSSWVKSGEAKLQKPGGNFEECLIELEWVSSAAQADSDSGTLTVLTPDGVTTKIQFSLSEITCIQCCSEPGSPRIAIHAPRLQSGCSPIKLQFSGDTEMEDWISHLTSVCCQINEVHGKPANDSIWVTTDLGDVFVFDPSNTKASQLSTENNLYAEKIDVSATETPYYNILSNG